MVSKKSQTAKANEARMASADKFAMTIIDELNDIEQINSYRFRSLYDRCVALNAMNIPTRRGGKWTKTQMSRVLSRIEKLACKP